MACGIGGIEMKKLVTIGDSLTFCYGISMQSCWTHILEHHLKIKVINKGINGDTTLGMLSRFEADVVQSQPHYVMIMGGTNDLMMGNHVNHVTHNVDKMIEMANESHIDVILAVPPPIDVENVREEWIVDTDFASVYISMLDYRKNLLDFAQHYNLIAIDFFQEMYNHTNGTIDHLFIDGIHLNEEGNAILSNIAISNLRPLLLDTEKRSFKNTECRG